MGTIDSVKFTLSCSPCGTSESQTINDFGSTWGGSNWGSRADFKQFSTQLSGGNKEEPTISLATCKKCGANATVERKFAG